MNQYQQRRMDIERAIGKALAQYIGEQMYEGTSVQHYERVAWLGSRKGHIANVVLHHLDEREMLRITDGGGKVAK